TISITGVAINGGAPAGISIAGNNIIDANAEKFGFTLSGTESGADGQTVTVTFGSLTSTTTASGGQWTATFLPTDPTKLPDGNYVVTATVTGPNGAAQTSQTIRVDAGAHARVPPAAAAPPKKNKTRAPARGSALNITLSTARAVFANTSDDSVSFPFQALPGDAVFKYNGTALTADS